MEYFNFVSLCQEIRDIYMTLPKKPIEINPFVINNPISVIQVNAKGTITKNAKDGVMYDGAIIKSTYYIDKQEKVQLYRHSVSFMDELLFGTLNSKGRDLYLYVQNHLPKNQDYLELKISKITSSIGISRNSVVTAIKELKLAGIIASKAQSMYWINPEFIFNGNRVNFYREVGEQCLKTVNIINR